MRSDRYFSISKIGKQLPFRFPSQKFGLMPGPVRESYNAKARRSTAGSRKKGKKRKDQKTEPQEDSNANILTSESREEKEAAKRIKLLDEVRTLIFQSAGNLTLFSACSSVRSEMDKQEKEEAGKVYCKFKIYCGNFSC